MDSEELAILAPIELTGASEIINASLIQTIFLTADGLTLAGLPIEGDKLNLFGHDSFTLRLHEDKRLSRIDQPDIKSDVLLDLLAMNDREEILGVEASTGLVVFYDSIDSLVLSPSNPKYLKIPSNAIRDKIVQIVAGNGHFLLRTKSSIFSYGDNRFNQCSNLEVSDSLQVIDYFDGLELELIAAGGFHSCVVANGSLYTFGLATAFGGERGEISLVSLVEEGKDEPEIISVSCGSTHTVLVTSSGDVYSAGSNRCGQLGLGDVIDRTDFTKLDVPPMKSVICSKWSTFLSS